MKRQSSLVLVVTLVLTAALGAQQRVSPIADAAMRGDKAAVRDLLKQGADVNGAQGDGMSALHWAAERGDAELAEMLIYAGANIAAVTRIGQYTPLHLAAKSGSAPLARTLLKAGADVNARSTNSGASPLHLAASAGSAEIINILLDAVDQPHVADFGLAKA
ncbi:MAG: ankyrin repeat domain-containing protein, partial [Acidobacteriota bacterium]|nr:ankyrin repeat domain-containing protein [Acidobacteriota bacterium]